ncbi:hemoblobin-interacting domain-containing protein [Cohnella soli]|uniref:S-layer homology domain-containing protein n=1 Tax=Cohnella soli TaxID=425005 RepID=A0ABW0HL58_9BACL
MMLATRMNKVLLVKLSMILAGIAFFSVLSISSPSLPRASAALTWAVCGLEGTYCSFTGTRTVGYGTDYVNNSKRIAARTYNLPNGSAEGVGCFGAEFGSEARQFTTCYMLIDPDAELDTAWSTSSSEDNKTVSVSFAVKETQVGTIADLKSKIKIKRTDDTDFQELDPEDVVSNVTTVQGLMSLETSKIQITFKNPLMGSGNQLLIQAGALANRQGVILDRPIAIDVNENVLGSWQLVGNRGLSDGMSTRGLGMAVLNGTPYVAYTDDAHGMRLFVKKYDGISWVPVDGGGLSAGFATAFSMVSAGDSLYVAYYDYSDSLLHIKKYNGSNWSSIDSGSNIQIPLDGTGLFSLAIYNHTPYIAYSDKANGNRLTVKSYNGTGWDLLGVSGISQDAVSHISLAISEGIPYVAYRNEFPIFVNGLGWTYRPTGWAKKFDQASNSWSDLGKFTNDQLEKTTMVVKDGVPYVAYVDMLSGRTGTTIAVKKREANGWTVVDGYGSISNGTAYSFDVSGGELYLTYIGTNGKTAVKKLIGSQWTGVGDSGMTVIGKANSSLYAENEVPYLVTSSTSLGNSDSSAKNFSPDVYKFLLDTPVLTADLTNNNTVSPVVVTFPDSAAWRSAITAVKDGAVTLAPETYTISAGKITFNAGTLGLGSHAITVSASPRYKETSVSLIVYLRKPIVTADTSNNDVGHPIELTFPDDAAWRGAITGVKDGASAISGYSVSPGKITFPAGVLAEGNHTLTIKATDYVDITVNQAVTLIPSPALTADATDNDAASALEITFPDDEGWRNAITAVKDGTTTLPLSKYRIDAGVITFKAGALAAGNHTITILADNYKDATVIQNVGMKPPTLTADTTNNDVMNAIEIEFPDDPSWRGAITAVKDGATTLPAEAYAVTSGKITFNAGVLSEGSHTLTITATNYSDATIHQDIEGIRASDDALLSDMAVDQGSLTFVPSQLEYSVNVLNGTTSIGFYVTKANSNQTLAVTGADEVSVTGNVYAYSATHLAEGPNVIAINVTAQDGTTINPYRLLVNRAPAASGNADLRGITLLGGTLSPAFASGTTDYTSRVDYTVSNLTLTASLDDSKATMTVKGNPAASGQPSGVIGLDVGPNVIPIVVTAEDGTSKKTYTVTVTRDEQSRSPGDGGSGGPGSGPTAPGSTPVTSDNGQLSIPKGGAGEVSLRNEVKVSIPADATAKDLNITIDKLLDAQNLISPKEVLVSPIFEILKNFSENFNQPVTLTFVFDPSSLTGDQKPSVFYYDEMKKEWVEVGGVVDGTHIVVKVNHFTKYAVFAVEGTPEVPTDTDLKISDIFGHWAESDIRALVQTGAINGYPDQTFKPNNSITRAEFVSILVKALKLKASDSLSFDDTTVHWAKDSIGVAAALGLVSGFEDHTFRPNELITREQMATIAVRALGLNASGKSIGFADNSVISSWAIEGVAAAADNGLINGYKDGTFRAKNNTTRAEAVTVIVKAMALKSRS